VTPGAAGTHRVVVSLGSNLGDREDNLAGAVVNLGDAPGIDVVGLSPVYETAPVGVEAQEPYLNAILLADTSNTPLAFLERCQAIEAAFGRVRTHRWAPRTLDVDVIDFDGLTRDDPALTLPHPRAHERAFVLIPWVTLDADGVLPGYGRIADLVRGLAPADVAGVVRRDDITLGVDADLHLGREPH